MWLLDQIAKLLNPTRSLVRRRDLLLIRQDEIYADIGILEKEETKLLDEGRVARAQGGSLLQGKRIASGIARVRSDLNRQHELYKLVGAQVGILNSNLHHRALVEQSKAVKMPNLEQLNVSSVDAEEAIDQLASIQQSIPDMVTMQSVDAEQNKILAELGWKDETKKETAPPVVSLKDDDEESSIDAESKSEARRHLHKPAKYAS